MTDDDLRAAYDGVDQSTADWHIRGLRAVAALVKAERLQPEPSEIDTLRYGTPTGAPPPAAPEPSEAEVAAAMASLYRAMEPAAWPSEDEVTDALRAAAAARKV